MATWGTLEISTNGKDWQQIDFQQNKNRIHIDGGKAPIKSVRFTNNQETTQEIYLRQFMITIEK